MVKVKYFILEDGDDMNHPNVFDINDSYIVKNGVQLNKVKEFFPLPGLYHFRYLKHIGSLQVWMDLKDDDAVSFKIISIPFFLIMNFKV